MGHNPTDEEIIKMISDVDSTGDGAISYKFYKKRFEWFYQNNSILKIQLRIIWWRWHL